MKWRLGRYLLAILAGNALYFGVERWLPVFAQHQAFQIDWGLAVDFAFCAGCYGIVRLVF